MPLENRIIEEAFEEKQRDYEKEIERFDYIEDMKWEDRD